LIEQVQSLVNLGLGIGRGGTLRPRRRGLTGNAIIAGIDVAKRCAAATSTGPSVRDAAVGLTTLTSAGLTTLTLTLPGLTTLTLATFTLTALALFALAVLPLLLTLLSALAGLTVGHELTGLELAGLSATALLGLTLTLALTRLRIGLRLPAETVQLIAQTRQVVHGAIDLRVPGSDLSATQGARRVTHLLTQLLQVASECGFLLIGEFPAAQTI
jgi:hypothetical protein